MHGRAQQYETSPFWAVPLDHGLSTKAMVNNLHYVIALRHPQFNSMFINQFMYINIYIYMHVCPKHVSLYANDICMRIHYIYIKQLLQLELFSSSDPHPVTLFWHIVSGIPSECIYIYGIYIYIF